MYKECLQNPKCHRKPIKSKKSSTNISNSEQSNVLGDSDLLSAVGNDNELTQSKHDLIRIYQVGSPRRARARVIIIARTVAGTRCGQRSHRPRRDRGGRS
jgi:hypothetical protein